MTLGKPATVSAILEAIRSEGVPILIVVVLLGLYSYLLVVAGDAPDDLRTLVAAVVAFYFGQRGAGQAVAAQRAAIERLTNGKEGT